MNATTTASPIGKVLIAVAVLLAAGGSAYFVMNPGKSQPPAAKPAAGNAVDAKPAESKPAESKPEATEPLKDQPEPQGANQNPEK